MSDDKPNVTVNRGDGEVDAIMDQKLVPIPKKRGARLEYGQKTIDDTLYYIEHFRELGSEVPTHVGLALYLGRPTITLYTWAKDERKPEFKELMTAIKQIQHEMLVTGGLSKKYSEKTVALLLSKHGYNQHDKGHDKPVSVTVNRDGVSVEIGGNGDNLLESHNEEDDY